MKKNSRFSSRDFLFELKMCVFDVKISQPTIEKCVQQMIHQKHERNPLTENPIIPYGFDI
jgi:hypothetical protein